MDETLMQKATFSEICRIMKHSDGTLKECMHSIIELSLLFFPGLMCKDFASITSLEKGILNLDVKNVVDHSIASIRSIFNQEGSDFTSRSQNAQIAQVLIVFAAYFDTIAMYLPDANRSFALTPKERCRLTNASIDEYVTYLKSESSQAQDSSGAEIANYVLPLPNPIEGLDSYLRGLEHFYEILNDHFLDFVEKLSYLESIPGHKKDYFTACMNQIPKIALQNYKTQYYELSAICPDFFVWTNQQEHEVIKRSIDVGFNNVSARFKNIAETISESNAQRALSFLRKNYVTLIQQPVVNTSDMPLGKQEIVFPTKENCFIPQAFQTLIYQDSIELENTTRWIPRHEIGVFIADTLRSPELGTKPMLILGGPGAGKTMLCHMLAAKILYNEYHVIVLHLRNLVAEQEIHEQISHEIRHCLHGMSCSWSDIASSKLSKPILLIFDGYDELLQASGKAHSNYLERVFDFQRRTESIYGITVRTIVTSRIVLINKAHIPAGSPVILLNEFNTERINTWCRIWNTHNQSYFSFAHLEPFSLDSSSNAWELAKQPLLLLMLAIYDSNENSLRIHQDMSAPQLYNCLIRDFIEREQKKDPSFDQREPQERTKIIDREMERVCIAALGMHNRNELYIRSSQLQDDLNHLSAIHSDQDLQDSDHVLGSFFFIHRSDATESVEHKQIHSSAYEFLHNTFGEFLTAHYIILQLTSVIKAYISADEQSRLSTTNTAFSKQWYACLSYTPLCHRPVVVEMISSWAKLYFKSQGIPHEVYSKVVQDLVINNAPRILSGEILNQINVALSEFDSPDSFPKKTPFVHLATYSMNLFCVGSLVNDGLSISSVESNSIKIWDRMRNLWRFLFSNQILEEFSSCFQIIHGINGRTLQYTKLHSESQQSFSPAQFEFLDLFKTHVALDEELEYTALGALCGFDYPLVLSGLQRQGIPKKAWISLRHFMDDSNDFLSDIRLEDLYLLDSIFAQAIEEKDVSSLFFGIILLKYLTDPKNHDTFRYLEDIQVTNSGWLSNTYHQISWLRNEDAYSKTAPVRIGILEVLCQLPLTPDDCENIFESLIPYKFKRDYYSGVELSCLSNLAIKVIDTYLEFGESIPIPKLDGFYRLIEEQFEMICRGSTISIPDTVMVDVLKATAKGMVHCDTMSCNNILITYHEALDKHIWGQNIPTCHIAPLLNALKLYHSSDSDGTQLAVDFFQHIYTSGTNAIDLFDINPNTILDLCFLSDRFPHDIGLNVIPLLIDLVEQRANEISYGLYKQLLKMSHSFSSEALYSIIAEKLG